jgi:tetratricopeptide (TPR) repeat protein
LRVGVRARAERSGSPRLLEVLAEVEQRLERWEDAAGTVERLRKAQPDDERLLWALLGLYSRLERWAAMATLLGEVTTSREGNSLRQQYIEALTRSGQAELAGTEITKLVASVDRSVPHHVAALADLTRRGAWNLRDAGREPEAQALFRLALELDADDAESRTALLHLYGSEEERSAHASALAARWAEETDPRALLEQATERLTGRDYAGAFELLQRAAPDLPDLEAVWYNLGIAAYRIERWTEADAAFARAAELNPGRADSAFFRGLALTKLERCADAIAPLERALELDPARSLAHYHLFLCHGQLGQLEAAERHGRAYEASKPQG